MMIFLRILIDVVCVRQQVLMSYLLSIFNNTIISEKIVFWWGLNYSTKLKGDYGIYLNWTPIWLLLFNSNTLDSFDLFTCNLFKYVSFLHIIISPQVQQNFLLRQWMLYMFKCTFSGISYLIVYHKLLLCSIISVAQLKNLPMPWIQQTKHAESSLW